MAGSRLWGPGQKIPSLGPSRQLDLGWVHSYLILYFIGVFLSHNLHCPLARTLK